MTALRPGPAASSQAVAASLARSLAPPEDGATPPPWLRTGQHRSFRRTLAAVRRHRGAVLADPVGSGKSYVALAVAAEFNGLATTACLVPATLAHQWAELAARLGVPIALASHEQASRGRLPQRTRGLVIVDESHHFRNRHTNRYRHLSRWLVGRPALLVTATPIVNRLDDLAHQLWLAVRDNALVLDGITSLRALLARGCTSPALSQLVVQSEEVSDGRPCRDSRI
ncbi:MAG TPA: SNF2-related protein, partial [Gemmatimonadales bacterium]|nr:SNF2-related protein [Gemmatimonadales bacterium]